MEEQNYQVLQSFLAKLSVTFAVFHNLVVIKSGPEN